MAVSCDIQLSCVPGVGACRLVHPTGRCSVPARLGKGQGAKEIGRNLARERPKFGHNLVRKRHKIGHSLEREWPSRAYFYEWTTKIWSPSNTGTNLQAFYKNLYIGCLKTQKQQLHFEKINNKFKFKKKKNFFWQGAVQIRQDARQYGQGAAPSEIGLAGTLLCLLFPF